MSNTDAYDVQMWCILIHEVLKNTKKMSIRHFVISMKCTAQHKQGKLLKNEKQARKHVYQASYFQYQQNPFNQTQQN